MWVEVWSCETVATERQAPRPLGAVLLGILSWPQTRGGVCLLLLTGPLRAGHGEGGRRETAASPDVWSDCAVIVLDHSPGSPVVPVPFLIMSEKFL